jgi:hypothetical protein
MRGLVLRRGITWWLAALLPACSALVDGQLGVVRCKQENAYGPPACPAGQTCLGGACSPVGAPPGASCAIDQDCRAPASCADMALIGEGSGKRCLLPCCTSGDCMSPELGYVCRPIPTGAGSFCWQESELSNRDAPGVALPGSPCSSGTVCRSGLCEGGRCVDSCCGDASCSVGSDVCRITQSGLSSAQSWTCAGPPTEMSGVGACNGPNDCRTGSCSFEYKGTKYCLAPCCSSKECSLMVGELRTGCARFAGVRACVRVIAKMASLKLGASCSTNDACTTGLCLDEGGKKYCSDLCCDDASCGDLSRFACRPGPVEGAWALRCVRK